MREVAEPDVGEPGEDGVRGRRAGLAGAEELLRLADRHREHLADVAAAELVIQHRGIEALALALLAGGGDAGHHRQVGVDRRPAPLQLGQAPSELALNSAGFTPLALANALRIGSSRPV